MAKGDTKTNQYLDIAANGTRADLPTDTCCETRSQTLIREVAERIMDVEDEVEELKNNPDVVDIVATYADLQAYDTQHLTDKDIIRVLQDETHDGESTYYRYNKQSDTWTYVGESKQYEDFVGTDGTAAGEAGLVPAPAATDAGKFLKADGTWDTVQAGSSYTAGDGINISAQDVISATNTGKTKHLTSADYNYDNNNDGVNDCIALWLLDPGIYTADNNVYCRWRKQTGMYGGTWVVGQEDATHVCPIVQIQSANSAKDSCICYTYKTNGTGYFAEGALPLITRTENSLTYSLSDKALTANQGKVLKDFIGDLTNLTTTAKTSVVAAINELDSDLAGKQDTLTAGDNITIEDESGALVISATDTTYSAFTGTDGTAAGSAGLVPAPATTDAGKFLKADGTWDDAAGSTYTAGDGIDITNDIISATNTGKARVLTTADYNYPTANPDGVALWLLEPGVYTIKQGVKYYQSSSQSETTSVTLVIGNDTSTYSPSGGGAIPALAIKNTGSSGQIFEEWVFNPAFNSFISRRVMPTISQSTGASTTSVMSQNAVTSMVYADPSTRRKILIGTNAISGGDYSVVLGQGASSSSGGVRQSHTVAIGGGGGGAFGTGATTTSYSTVTIGSTSSTSAPFSVAIGAGSQATAQGQFDIGCTVSSLQGTGYNNSNYRLLTGLYDGQSAHDAATYGQVISYSAINGAGAPTTATEGKYVGQLYYDTTNEAMYFLKTIDTTTTPATYTWEALGGGSSVNVVQTTGTSTTDVMSQNAATSMVFADPSERLNPRIGNLSNASGNQSTAVGYEALSTGAKGVTLGAHTVAQGAFSVAVGAGAEARAQGVFSIDTGQTYTTSGYNNSNYRLLTGLYDPQNAHDAATKGYVDPSTDSSAPTTATVGRLGQIQIDTTNADAYMCVAADDVTPTYTWKKITA